MSSRVTLQPQVRLRRADAGHAQGDDAGLAQGPRGLRDLLAFVVREPVQVGLDAADQCADALDFLFFFAQARILVPSCAETLSMIA